MRLPTFSRQSESTTETADRAPVSARTDAPTHAGATAPQQARARAEEPRAEYPRSDDRTAPMAKVDDRTAPMARVDTRTDRPSAGVTPDRDGLRHDLDHTPPPVTPKPRASLLATLGLITGVGAALLVLSGPLLGYGIGVAALSLILSLLGLRATRKRHVAGKTDALIGLVLALASIVVGVLALTGSLSWLGTDMEPVNSLRQWLDAQFIDRF